MFFSIFFRSEGNFDIDAREGRGGPFRTPQIPQNHKNSQKKIVRKLFTLLGHIFNKCSKIIFIQVHIYTKIQRIQSTHLK